MREGLHKVVSSDDTIAAISTPLGRSALGVVRLSGEAAGRIAARFFRPVVALDPRKAVRGRWLDENDNLIDEVVITLFCAPHSYTGEDIVEISAHGNPLSLNRILRSIETAGARMAGPGEFTLRAVAHGKMDLLQAEAVRDFIEAQTEDQARTALRQLEGALSKRVSPVKEKLVNAIAQLEAGIDFADEEIDFPDASVQVRAVQGVIDELNALQETFAYGRLLNEGLRLVIVGKPNVGKSSLFNRLVSSERAIVTSVPGTTRDVLTETVSIEGIPLKVFDTAGIRDTADYVESLGVGRSKETLAESDLALVVLDGSAPLDLEDRQVLTLVQTLPHLVIMNKCDLPRRAEVNSLQEPTVVHLSATTGEGLSNLESAFRAFLAGRRTDSLNDAGLTNARQNAAVMRAADSLRAGVAAISAGTPHEMALLDFYDALSALGELTGEVVTDDILGRIFATFCIGK